MRGDDAEFGRGAGRAVEGPPQHARPAGVSLESGSEGPYFLTDEGRGLFENLTAGRSSRDPVFVREDGKVWGPSHQQRPLEAASQRARIEPAATFHILRHTYASSLAMRGVPMGVIAAQLGQADTRMTERHYAHLAPNYVAETVRAALSPLGIVDRLNVAALARREKVRST